MTTIEREIFKRRVIHYDLLEKYGFIRTNEGYFIEKKIYEGMLARLRILSDGSIVGEVVDEEFGEVYVNHRLEDATGAFVVGVRHAYEIFLREISAAITSEKTYIYDQTNRIHDLIVHKYGVQPEFLWERFPNFGVYRNVSSRKWFAIIMNIGRGKVVPGETGEVEVMNLKLDERANHYIAKGAYPSYHMNHKSWVTVILDGTLPDSLIEEMIEISYANSVTISKKRKK